MERNPLGIDTEVFAGNADPSQRIKFGTGAGDDYELGWASDYSTPGSGKYPSRKNFNSLFATFTAMASDINRFGSNLPWDTNIPYEQGAIVTSPNGTLYQALSANTGKDPDDPSNTEWYLMYGIQQVDDLSAVPIDGGLYLLTANYQALHAPIGLYTGKDGAYLCVTQLGDYEFDWAGSQVLTYTAGVKYNINVTAPVTNLIINLFTNGEATFYLDNASGYQIAEPTIGLKRTVDGLRQLSEPSVELVLTNNYSSGNIYSAIALVSL